MTIDLEEIRERVASDPLILGRMCARHAYGLKMWIDILGAKLTYFEDLEHKALMARVIHEYAGQMILDRDVANRLGVDDRSYNVTPEGRRVYDRFAELDTDVAVVAFLLGSLEPPPEGYDSQYITVVEPWIQEIFDRMDAEQSELRQLLTAVLAEMDEPDAERYRQEVKDMYAQREPQELDWYLNG